MKDLAFYLGLGALLTHELDAMPNHEWRMLFVLRALPDEVGMATFVALHVPALAALIAWVASINPRTRAWARRGVSAFLIVHSLLHAIHVGDPSYEFASALSNILIFGGAACGAVYLALDGRERLGRS